MLATPHLVRICSIFGACHHVGIDYVYRHISERDWQKRTLPLRLIASWDAKSKKHRLYVTNATSAQLGTAAVPGVYAMRWEVELLFRELSASRRGQCSSC